jgi:hypothetical protein
MQQGQRDNRSVLHQRLPSCSPSSPSHAATVAIESGQDAAAGRYGLSWTTDRDVTLGFARGKRVRNDAPALYSAVVNWADIAFACVDRQESEIVLSCPPHEWMAGAL